MPITIYRREGKENVRIAWLCDDTWEMPQQVAALEKWLVENRGALSKGSYVADIGYAPREGALGGGAAVTVAAMEAMVAIGMELFLSEYPPVEPN
jgi:hypothetical protein